MAACSRGALAPAPAPAASPTTTSAVTEGHARATASNFSHRAGSTDGPGATRIRAPAARTMPAIMAGSIIGFIGLAMPTASAAHIATWVSSMLGSSNETTGRSPPSSRNRRAVRFTRASSSR